MMEKLLRKELWLKLFSVGAAIVLWAVVMQDYTAETTRSFEVPLRVKPHPTFQVYEGPQDRESMVEIRVSDRNLLVSRIKPDTFVAEVDYAKVLEPGKATAVEVRVSVKDDAQVKYHVVPKTVTVTLVENRETQVPVSVQPQFDVIPYQNREWRYTATAASRTATVGGRSDYLILVKEAILSLEPQDLLPTTTRISKKVIPLDAAGKPVDKLESTYMDVELAWEQLPTGKSVKVNPTTTGSVPQGYVVIKLEPTPTAITLRSATLNGTLPDLDTVDTLPVDLTGHTTSFAATVRLAQPPGATLVTETVSVAVTVAESTIEKSYKNLPIQVHGKAANQEVALSVTDVQVKLTAPFSTLHTLEAAALSAYVDVENMRDGKHVLPVRISRPRGITEELVDPATVEVTLTTR